VEIDPTWQVRAVWLSRDGTTTEQQYQFHNYPDARREALRLSSHLGLIGQDDRALKGVEINGNFWGVTDAPVRAEPGWDQWIRPSP
jgi:hypothetical protein